MKNLLIFLLLCVAFMACKKHNTDPPPDAGSVSYKIKTATTLDDSTSFTYTWEGAWCSKIIYHSLSSSDDNGSGTFTINNSYLIGISTGNVGGIDTMGMIDVNGNFTTLYSTYDTSFLEPNWTPIAVYWDTTYLTYNSNQQISSAKRIHVSKDLTSNVITNDIYNITYTYVNDLPILYSYTSNSTDEYANGSGTISYYDTVDVVGFRTVLDIIIPSAEGYIFGGLITPLESEVIGRLGKPIPKLFKQQIITTPYTTAEQKWSYILDSQGRVISDNVFNYTY